jgi:hypothetical protein
LLNCQTERFFSLKGKKMFVASIENVASVMTTIAEKKIQYSAAEVKKAEMAYELL